MEVHGRQLFMDQGNAVPYEVDGSSCRRIKDKGVFSGAGNEISCRQGADGTGAAAAWAVVTGDSPERTGISQIRQKQDAGSLQHCQQGEPCQQDPSCYIEKFIRSVHFTLHSEALAEDALPASGIYRPFYNEGERMARIIFFP